MSITILIVEDDMMIASLLKDHLAQSGVASIWLGDGTQVVPLIRQQMPDLIMLDLMLPGRNGVEICQEIRTFSEVPIIMISGSTGEDDRLLGLEVGADDYICKPFSLQEVLARVKMVLRRVSPRQDPATFRIDFEEGGRIRVQDKYLDLTVVEYRLLRLLSHNPGRIYSRQELMLHIYPSQRIVCDRTIDCHIKKLRKKILQASPAELIHSLYGIGYKYEAPT